MMYFSKNGADWFGIPGGFVKASEEAVKKLGLRSGDKLYYKDNEHAKVYIRAVK